MSQVVRVARYLRVSRIEQNPALQDDETADLIAKRGWKLVETYVDHGVSGSREKRPALDRLHGDARRHRMDVVVVWKADRLFRSLKAMVNTLDEWAALGIGFVSATEAFDTTTPQGKLLTHLTSRSTFRRASVASTVVTATGTSRFTVMKGFHPSVLLRASCPEGFNPADLLVAGEAEGFNPSSLRSEERRRGGQSPERIRWRAKACARRPRAGERRGGALLHLVRATPLATKHGDSSNRGPFGLPSAAR